MDDHHEVSRKIKYGRCKSWVVRSNELNGHKVTWISLTSYEKNVRSITQYTNYIKINNDAWFVTTHTPSTLGRERGRRMEKDRSPEKRCPTH